MLTEEQIKSIRGKNKVPEYKNIFPPVLSRFYDDELVNLATEASLAIGNLNSYAKIVPNPDLLIGPMLLREALASSRIEGTEATARDIVRHDAGIKLSPKIRGEAFEVINHRESTKLGLKLLDEKNLPLVNRVIKTMHEKLMLGVRGERRRLGSFRVGSNAIATEENNIESIIFLPPSANEVENLMKRLEAYLNEKEPAVNTILRCALAHYEFEAIHPFADGNGRLGRVLISLFLIKEKILRYPLLYMSGYLLREKELYYRALSNVTVQEDWGGWLKFFLRGVKEQALKSQVILEKIYSLYQKNKRLVEDNMKKSVYAPRLVEKTFMFPVITAPQASKLLKSSHAVAMSILKEMAALGLLKVNSRDKRNIPFYNEKLINLLEEV